MPRGYGPGPSGPGRGSGRGPGGGKGTGADHGGSDGRKPGTKICPTCRGSGRVSSGKGSSPKARKSKPRTR